MTYDPFLRAIVVILHRTILFAVADAIVTLLMWDSVSRHALGLWPVDAITTAVGILFGRSEPVS
jgi:hypothetical protein